MFQSIVQDARDQFRSGNMITRLILINVVVWATMALLQAFVPSFYSTLLGYVALPGQITKLLLKPWTLLTHIFVHSGLWHLVWNMLILYWFGRIVGDLVGDKHILPLFFAGAAAGAIAFIISYALIPSVIGAYAIGASAGVMAIVMAAGRLAPDYLMHLILIGPVKLKYVVLALVFFDIIGAGGTNNTGGHIAHLVGAIMGWYFVSQMGNKKSITGVFTTITNWFDNVKSKKRPAPKSNLHVTYKSDKIQKTSTPPDVDRVDQILDKIKAKGFNSLTNEEKEILAQASKA